MPQITGSNRAWKNRSYLGSYTNHSHGTRSRPASTAVHEADHAESPGARVASR